MGSWDCPKPGSNVRNENEPPGLRGFFSEEGLVGILEANDMKHMDNISQFLGAINDRTCGEVEKEQ